MTNPKVVLVTGANSGIGYETVKALLKSGRSYHVLLGARTPEKAQTAIESMKQECPDLKNTVEPIAIDLTSDESINKAVQQIENSQGHLDCLVNNAGATFDIDHMNKKVTLRESFTLSYNVNVAGTNVLTHQSIPLLLKSPDPRLIFVAGLSHITVAAEKYFPTPEQPAGWPKPMGPHDFETIGYRCSKVALNMLMLDWNHKLKNDGVKVWGVGPGFLNTNLGGFKDRIPNAGHPSEGGDILRRVIEGERDKETGKVVVKNGGIMPW